MNPKDPLVSAIANYSKKNGYVATKFIDVVCGCGPASLKLYSDDEQGSAKCVCEKCGKVIDIEDSLEYASELVNNVCNCSNPYFQVMIGTAYYEGGKDPRWIYVGCKRLFHSPLLISLVPDNTGGCTQNT